MDSLVKALGYLSLLPNRPQEFFERAIQLIELRLDRLFRRPPPYQAVNWDSAIQSIEGHLGHVAGSLSEPALDRFEEQVHQRLASIEPLAQFSLDYCNADLTLARCCYLVCRLLKPNIVIETGVAYGVTSAFILMALKENDRGVLHSIDLPLPGRKAESFVGSAIPEVLKSRWNLHRGFSKHVLPKLLRETETVDVFVQDSTHTHRNMRREFETLWPHLRSGGVIIADDIQGNRAFGELKQQGLSFQCIVQEAEKRALFGVAAK